MTPGRRALSYESFDDVMLDVERLLGGYSTVGHWSLGQMCRHLAAILRASVDMPASSARDPSLLVGEERKRAMLESGALPEGVKTAPPFEPPAGLDDREEAEGLRAAIIHYKASPGPVIAHPLFGEIPRTEWDRFHCHHCAHHLSFAFPSGGGSPWPTGPGSASAASAPATSEPTSPAASRQLGPGTDPDL